METTFPIRVQVSNCATINKTRCRRQTNSSAAPSAGLENQGLILPLAHNLTLAGRCKPDCDPRKHYRRGSPVANIYPRGTRRAGSSLARAIRAIPISNQIIRRMRCIFQRVIRRIHAARLDLGNLLLIASIASQKRSSSAFVSDSVGSTISVPETGQLIVGA